MTRSELERVGGSRLSDAELIAAYLEDNCMLRGSIKEAGELIKEALRALGLVRVS